MSVDGIYEAQILCPYCGSLSPLTAVNCACGYTFPRIPSREKRKSAWPFFLVFAAILLVAFLLVMAIEAIGSAIDRADAKTYEEISKHYDEGFDAGYDYGYERGLIDAAPHQYDYFDSYDEGYEKGYEDGYSKAILETDSVAIYDEGYSDGYYDGQSDYEDSLNPTPREPFTDYSDITYVGDPETDIFHYTYCEFLPPLIDLPFTNEREVAIYNGYTPCEHCNP